MQADGSFTFLNPWRVLNLNLDLDAEATNDNQEKKEVFYYSVPPGKETQFLRLDALPLAEFYYYHSYVPTPDLYYERLMEEIPWDSGEATVYGKTYTVKRLVTMMALNTVASYTFSGKRGLIPFSPTMELLRRDVSRVVFGGKGEFNSCLCNLYRDGTDTIGMHRDKEDSLVWNAPIASVTLGTARHFDLQCDETTVLRDHPKAALHSKLRIDLAPGSLLIMGHNSQLYYKHGVPVSKRVTGARINLTFRVAKNEKSI